ncbi:MAG: glycosyltransferase family 2 protein [Nocardioides sp.]
MSAAPPDASTLDAHDFTYSVVIPVYNSERLVGTTVDDVLAVFAQQGLTVQVVLVNDGSSDGSWEVVRDRAGTHTGVVALDLLANYGQHHANLAGLRETTGDFVVTMDDDGQNPADQVPLLIEAAMRGHDVVFGVFERKEAACYRRLGSRLVAMVNRRVFGQPSDLTVSNFRILRRDVVDRICASRTAHPYLTGQALMYSGNRGNVSVRHEPRSVGTSTYSLPRILRLVLTILFSYSSWPLRTLALLGFGVAVLSFVLGAVYLVTGLLTDTRVEGWTTIVVLLAVFNGFTIGLLSMLGEYVVRTLNAVSAQDTYHVRQRAGG